MFERYRRQIMFEKIGEEGQKKLCRGRVLIVGMGALGCMNAMLLARAGVGFLRIADGDKVEEGNLHRQFLYTVEDAGEGRLKVFAAAEHLKAAAPDISLDPVPEFLSADNIRKVLQGVDLVIDATDNIKTRLLINDHCAAFKIPWIYGGVMGAEGMTAAFMPGGPCLRCFLGGTAEKKAADVGILGMLPAAIASFQSMEAVKILTGAETVRKEMLWIDLWNNEQQLLPVAKDPACPVCGAGGADQVKP